MNQGMLFKPASRSTDLETSHAAEKTVTESGARKTQAQQVLELLKRYPGNTSAELAYLGGTLNRWQTARRLPDLEHNGLAHKGKAKHCAIAKKSSVTWWPAKIEN